MLKLTILTIRVEFPALDALVNYLNRKDQAEIDAITGKVAALTPRLKQSQQALQGAITQQRG